MKFKTSAKSSASTKRVYEDIWTDWEAWCREGEETPANYDPSTYVEWLQALEDVGVWSNASSALRHVYKENGLELPPTRSSLVILGSLTLRKATPKKPVTEAPEVAIEAAAETTTETKPAQDSTSFVPKSFRPMALQGHYVTSADKLCRGDHVRIGARYYLYTGVALAEVDRLGQRTGSVYTLSHMRKAHGGYLLPTFESDITKQLAETLYQEVGLDIREPEDLTLELVCAVLRQESVDALIENFGDIPAVITALMDELYPADEPE